MNPTLKVGVQKKLKKLYFTFGEEPNENILELDIVNNEVDLILIDEWITGILKKESEKINLKNNFSFSKFA